MTRKASGRIPRSLQKKHKAQQVLEAQKEAIDPFQTGNPSIQKPPDIVRPPQALVRAPASSRTSPLPPSGLPLPQEAEPPQLPPSQEATEEASQLPQRLEASTILERLGGGVFIGKGAEESHEFWIELKEEVLGGLQLRISLQGKQLSATLIAANAGIKHILKQRIPALRDQLQSRGMKIQKLDIVLAQDLHREE